MDDTGVDSRDGLLPVRRLRPRVAAVQSTGAEAGVRLRRDRRRVGGRGRRQQAVRDRTLERFALGSRPGRERAVRRPVIGRLSATVAHGLAVQNRTDRQSVFGAAQRPVQLAPRQSAGRLERAELHAVRAGQPARLRRVARHGQRGLGLRRRAAVLHQVGGQPEPVPGPARVAVPPGRWPVDGAGGAVEEPAGAVVRGGRPGSDGLPEQGHQREVPDRVHGRAGHDPARNPVQHGQSVPAAGQAAGEPAHRDARARHQGGHQPGHQPGDRGAVRAGRPVASGAREARSDPLGRQHRQPAVADAVRRRPRRAPAAAGRAGAAGPPGRRQPPRPRGHVRVDVHRGQAGGHRPEPTPAGAGDDGIPDPGKRAHDHAGRRRGPRVRAHRLRQRHRLPGHPVPHGAGQHSVRRRHQSAEDPGRPGLHLRPGVPSDRQRRRVDHHAAAAPAQVPGNDPAPVQGPDGLSVHRRQLFRRPSGRGHARGGRQTGREDRPGQGVPAVPVAAPSGAHTRLRPLRVRLRRVLGVLDPALQHDHLPSGGHVQDGPDRRSRGRRGPQTPGVRRPGAASGRRVHHAHHSQRQHQRADHHDRGEGVRHDQTGLVIRQSLPRLSRARVQNSLGFLSFSFHMILIKKQGTAELNRK